MRHVSFILMNIFMLSYHLHAQVQIEGRVLDNATGEPLAGASVYFNHTTVGTTTRSDGFYSLPSPGSGDYELVVSYVGYESILYDVKVRSKDLRLMFRMEAKVAQMKDILIVASQVRKQWLDIFRKQFLGNSPAAEATTIVNQEDIVFFNTGDENLIGAYSDVPLVVENRALGYRIFFELLSFNYHIKTYKSSFFGYNRYEELKEEDQNSSRYAMSRRQAYMGSTMHFFRSLKANRVREEGFSMRIVEASTKKRKSPKNGETVNAESGREAFVPGKSSVASRNNIVFFDSSLQQHFLLWEGGLEVSYLPPSQMPTGMAQSGTAFGTSGGLISYIFLEKKPVYILDDGMPVDPRVIRFGGWWNMERVANMLPQDYDPESKSFLNKKRL